MENRIRVIVVEHEREVLSLLSLSLAETKECVLEVCPLASRVTEKLAASSSALLLLNAVRDSTTVFEILKNIQSEYPGLYVIVSIPEGNPGQTDLWMASGAFDCVVRDRNYVTNLVKAIKTALIRIAEREAFETPSFSRAEQFAIDENLPDVILSLDLRGRILYANHAVTTLLGYEQQQVVGKQFPEFICEAVEKTNFQNYLEHVFERKNFRQSLLLEDIGGARKQYEINFTLIEDEMIYGVARAVSEEEGVYPEEESLEPLEEDIQTVLPAKVGAYRVITLLGAGAMGRVYKGFDEQLERYVAIKVTNRAVDPNERSFDRFRREAKILASISHPNIALIYYFGSLEGMPYFCMEYLPNGSIEELLQTRKKVSPDEAISYVSQAAAGLREALSKGILHMDVKPSNLMLAEDGRLKIVDFGLAQSSLDMHELERNIIGTPLYVAPEQIIGRGADHRMDIYSLGISFFEMLYGFIPFSGKTVADIFQQKLRSAIPARSELDLSVPAVLYDIVANMTAPDPANRISHYSEIIDALENVRRTSAGVESIPETVKPAETSVTMNGLLYDVSIPEILGQVSQERMNGKLTINWGKLYKHLHFKNGRLIAILSNQEGEAFSDLVISHLPADAKMIRSLRADQSSDLYQTYTTILRKIPHDLRLRLSHALRDRAVKIVENLFSWMMGEFLFETGEFPGQLDLEIQVQDIIAIGVRQWLDYEFIRSKVFNGKCNVRLKPDFVRLLRDVNLAPSDRFLLFRFENEIEYEKLFEISGISEEEFARLLFLFHCLHLVTLKKVDTVRIPSPSNEVPGAVDSAVYYTHCAVKSYEQNNFWACVEYCKKALESRQDAGVYRLMGKALAAHPQFHEEAVEAYQKALVLSPGNAGIERDLGELRNRRKKI